jgi:hypothetical protein
LQLLADGAIDFRRPERGDIAVALQLQFRVLHRPGHVDRKDELLRAKRSAARKERGNQNRCRQETQTAHAESQMKISGPHRSYARENCANRGYRPAT